ncbi:glycosyltransferase [Streptomyces sp. CdTB01]|uniref:glycosyltransferase n=1 Tax=Streptomyces sp. CdTB01 TaxID=1725411 RepID=UPI00099EA53D|nr:glycosyltransferase [Streptomyces sp. CdTB01]
MYPARTCPRVLLLTSGPLEGQEGADIQLAATIAETVPGVEYLWFTRWPSRGRPRRIDHGHAYPVASWDGLPHVRQRMQVATASAVLAHRVELIHAVLTIGAGYPLFSQLWAPLLAARPVLHTVPGVREPAALRRCHPLGPTVALSQATAAQLRRAGFGDVRTVPPPVRLDRWPRRARPDHAVPVVLVTGNHDPAGGTAEALAAGAVAAGAGARFRMVMALRGRAGQDARALNAALRARAAAEGITGVAVLGNIDDMPSLMASVDVLLYIPRRLNGKADIPLTVLEALATGRPVILSDHPQFRSLGDAVLRSPVGDPGHAGRLLYRLLRQPALWDALAERGRSVVELRFGVDRFRAHYAGLYKEMLR